MKENVHVKITKAVYTENAQVIDCTTDSELPT